MAEIIDDSEAFTIALTENGHEEPDSTGALIITLGAAAVGLYLLWGR